MSRHIVGANGRSPSQKIVVYPSETRCKVKLAALQMQWRSPTE
ncbi:hypothetical protein [Oculatella sp. FACHB-28]|nr:hypothetical protein [Oculatella sp. FACHB-28]